MTEAPDQLTTMVTGVVFKSLANVGQYALPLNFSGAALASLGAASASRWPATWPTTPPAVR